MDFLRIEMTQEIAEAAFPTEYVGAAISPTSRTFGLFEEERPIALALFEFGNCDEREVRLVYVAVIEAERGKGLAGDLLDRCYEMLKKLGIEGVYSSFSGEIEELELADEFYQKHGFTTVGTEGIQLIYYMEDILDTAFSQKILEVDSFVKPVLSFNELTKEQQKDYTDKAKKHHLKSEEKLDLVFAKFFVIGSEVLGFIDMKELEPSVLVLTNYFVEKKDKAKFALPAMLAAVVRASSSFMPPQTTLLIQLEGESMLGPLESIFGSPVEYRYLGEYYKLI